MNLPLAKTGPKNPYAPFLDDVEKPARYIGGEHHQIVKEWTDKEAKVALCFPDVYEIGMSHLGFKILYDELGKQERIIAERVFCPWIDMEKVMRENSIPLVSMESYRPLKEFDILGFSLQYELTYTNILNMLDLAGLSVWQKERTDEDPFVICGGPCATHPEPLADFVDFFVVGDGEDIFAQLALFIKQMKTQGKEKKEILTLLGQWDGIYVPSLFETEIDELTGFEVIKKKENGELTTVKRFFIPSLLDYPIPTKSPIPHLNAIFDRYSVELARGCTEGCRFCQAGMIYRPVRERRPNEVSAAVVEGIKSGGFEEASLTCLSTADYSAVTPLVLDLLDKVKEQKATLGISSLRAYGLDERIFDKMAEVKNSSLTFAPEAGSERMRKVINKNISEEDLIKTANNVFSRGWKKMKLYFMIGLPTETDEDVQAIMETSNAARLEARKVGVRGPEITVSASSFVPKPHTPFQWSAMIELSEIERKQNMLKGLAIQYKLKFRKHLSKSSFMEGIVARGDRPIGKLIFDCWNKGARFDGWDETFDFDLWNETIAEHNLDLRMYLGTIRLDGRLPWDHIDVGLEQGFLEREWKKASKDRFSPPCGKVYGNIVHHSNLESLEKAHTQEKKRLVCYDCGIACDLTGMVNERRDFLTSMNAIEDKPYERPAVLKKDISELREKRGQNVGYRYRVEFSKLGSIAYISHLDLQKVVARIFKRAEVKVLYSEGYKARPLFGFGPALPLGIQSLSEFFDVRVPDEWENPEAILEQLSKHSEKGILFKSIQKIEKKTTSIQASMKKYHYFFPVEKDSPVSAEIGLKKLSETPEIIVSSFSKKLKSNVQKNIKEQIAKAWQEDLNIEEGKRILMGEFLNTRDFNGIHIITNVNEGQSVRPSEIKNGLLQLGLKVERPIKLAVN